MSPSFDPSVPSPLTSQSALNSVTWQWPTSPAGRMASELKYISVTLSEAKFIALLSFHTNPTRNSAMSHSIFLLSRKYIVKLIPKLVFTHCLYFSIGLCLKRTLRYYFLLFLSPLIIPAWFNLSCDLYGLRPYKPGVSKVNTCLKFLWVLEILQFLQ